MISGLIDVNGLLSSELGTGTPPSCFDIFIELWQPLIQSTCFIRSTLLPMNSLFRATVSLSNIYWQIADAQDKRTTIYFSEQCVLKVDYFPRAASQRFINVIDAPMEIDATVLLNIDCILLIIGNA